MNCLHFLLIYFYGFAYGMNLGATAHSSCKMDSECILLWQCKNYMNFINSLKKPLKPPVVDFLREKQCGFQDGYPKVCCSKNFRTVETKTTFKTCKLENECIPLKDCRPYTDLIAVVDEPLKPLVNEFLRTQHCGFQEGYPTVCCKVAPKKFKLIKPTRAPSKSPASSTELDLEFFSRTTRKTTIKPTKSVRDRQKNKSEAFNKAFEMANFLDYGGLFDLFRRRRAVIIQNLM